MILLFFYSRQHVILFTLKDDNTIGLLLTMSFILCDKHDNCMYVKYKYKYKYKCVSMYTIGCFWNVKLLVDCLLCVAFVYLGITLLQINLCHWCTMYLVSVYLCI